MVGRRLVRRAPVRRILQGLSTGGTYWMLVGSFMAAMGAYLFQLITTRSLDEIRYAPIGTLWTIQYLTVSIFLYAVETYITRASLRAEAETGTGAGAVPLAGVWASITVVAAAISGISWWFRDRLFQGRGDLAAVAGCIVLSFGAFMIVRGRLAGSGRFKAYGLVTASESICRFVLAVAIAVVAAGTRQFAWIMPLGALVAASWWPLLKHRRPDSGAQAVGAKPVGTGRFLVLTTSANAATQLLLAGGPLLLAFLHATPAEISVFFVTITAARLPIVFIFGGILSRLLGTFVRLAATGEDRSLRRAAGRIAMGTTAVAAVGGAAAAAIGAPLIGLLFGRGFLPPWWVAAGATVGVLLATGSMVLNQVLVARGSESRLPWPWVGALVGSGLTVALAGGSPLGRVVAGFLVGEIVALIGLMVTILFRDPGELRIAEIPAMEPLDPRSIDPA
jgi:O-antigen/teichoic acid export membrane protein